MPGRQTTGTAALLAIIAAVAGCVVTFTGRPFWGLLLDLLAVPTGVIGLIAAPSPRTGGGIVSILAIVLGVGGVGLGVLAMLGKLLT